MKKQKGFTLVELLGVIAILGVIATIATFSVLNIIESQKVELTKEQVANLKDSAMNYYIQSKKYLRVCASGTSVSTLWEMNAGDMTCSMKVSIGELVNKRYFENKNQICNENQFVLIYRNTSTDTLVYVPDGACGYGVNEED